MKFYILLLTKSSSNLDVKMFKWFGHKHYLLACSCAIALNCEGSILREQRCLQKFGLEAAYILKKDAASSISIV